MKIDARYLLEEPELGDAALPDSLELDLPIDGDRILGEVYLPAGVYEGPHPTVILCHGIPGTNNNDDVAQCLRRMGCVVIRPYHRGAWGSKGIYSFPTASRTPLPWPAGPGERWRKPMTSTRRTSSWPAIPTGATRY